MKKTNSASSHVLPYGGTREGPDPPFSQISQSPDSCLLPSHWFLQKNIKFYQPGNSQRIASSASWASAGQQMASHTLNSQIICLWSSLDFSFSSYPESLSILDMKAKHFLPAGQICLPVLPCRCSMVSLRIQKCLEQLLVWLIFAMLTVSSSH